MEQHTVWCHTLCHMEQHTTPYRVTWRTTLYCVQNQTIPQHPTQLPHETRPHHIAKKVYMELAGTQLSPQGQWWWSAPGVQYGGQLLPLFPFREIANLALFHLPYM